MELISHRGYWINLNEKNTVLSFERSFSLGFGTEVDIRDYQGKLVVSHDIPDENSLLFRVFLELFKKFDNPNLTLALNVKSDGLHYELSRLLNEFELKNYFVFDMSIPDSIGYINHNLPFFSRQSEYERNPVFYENCNGIWLDSFAGTWFNKEVISNHISNNKTVAIVSSELHGRGKEELWSFIKDSEFYKNRHVILCTDFPEEAREFFSC